MKIYIKICFSIFAFAFCNIANAQYSLTNGNFDGDWENCVPYVSGKNTAPTVGTQPTGWHAANVAGYYMVTWWGTTTVLTKEDGRSGNAVKLQNMSALSNVIPGYISLGTPWNTANTKGANNDGGTFGGVKITGHPDALEFYYKRSLGASSNTQPGSVVAYIWKGTTTQNNVPANIATSATKVTMTDRDVNILNHDYSLGDEPTYSNDFKLIATIGGEETTVEKKNAEVLITETPTSWTQMVCDFTYHSDEDPAKINIIFGAMENYAGSSNNEEGNILEIDDVKLLYYSELSSATYDGKTVSFTNGTASVDAVYDESKLALTSNGHAATINKNYNATTGILTVTVNGENISEDATNYHTYTIQFKPCSATMSISDAKYATFCAPFDVTVPSGVTASTASLKTGDAYTLNLTSVGSTINACTPVILYSESPVSTTFYGINKATTETSTYGVLTGVYASKNVTSGYVLQKNKTTGYVGFYQVTAESNDGKGYVSVPANRAYIANDNGVKVIYFDEATAIKALNALTSGEPTEIYSVSGARQDKLQKGMNIVKMADGSTQKILVK